MNNLIRITRPVAVKVASPLGIPPVYVPPFAGQVVRAGDATEDGYTLAVGCVDQGVVLEDEYDEVDESLYAWALNQFSLN